MQNQLSLTEKPLNITKLQKIVLEAIEKNPAAADDDAVLIATVWYAQGWDWNLSLERNIRRVTRPESITRRRRELFNLGLIDYSENASKRRMTAYRNERDMHSSHVPPEVRNI